ncbi:signal transduction histidine kinase [Burkholderiales bacterium JOSHI_001]|nr:signal transduction histidine kinase [Burkholderiales bacterium JOSHI_001]
MDAAPETVATPDARPPALAHALRVAAALLLVYATFTVAVDWPLLLQRLELTPAAALNIVASVGHAHEDRYQRLYTLALVPPASAAVALLLTLAALPVRRQAPAAAHALTLGALAMAYAVSTLPAHAPFVLPHAVPLAENGLPSMQEPYSRAFRDAITYVWSSALLLAIPFVGSARIEWRTKLGAGVLAVGSVLSAYLPHRAHEGGRTDNELIIFAFAIVALLYLSSRIQRAMEGERQAREQAEEALRQAHDERARYEVQSQAAIAEFRAIQQRLEEREQRRTAFLGAAAHDLKQPLLSSMLYSDLLVQALKQGAGQVPGPQVDRYAQTVRAEVKSLAGAFESILDYSQIESGRISARIGQHRLAEIFGELERRFAPQAAERGLTLHFVPPRSACVVQTDRDLIVRLLSNLLSNAVKFTAAQRRHAPRRGHHDVCVRTRVRGLLATVYVIDQGCGIPAHLHEAVFEPGVQVANAHRDRHEGFGLGLATVKGIVGKAMQDHGVRMRSIEQRGTHMMVDVPVAFVELEEAAMGDEADAGAPAVDLDGALIALVEDDTLQRAALEEVLRLAGAFVKAAPNLSQLGELLDETIRYPDVILTDFRLPGGVTGREVVETVRARCNGREIPALVLTADHLAAEAATVGLPGVEVLRKPVDRKTLLQRVSARHVPLPSPFDGLADELQASSRSTTPARAIS